MNTNMYARFPPFFGQPGPSCGVRRSGFFACPAPDTAVPIRVRRRVEPAPAVMAMVVAGRWQIREARQHVCSVGAGRGTPAAGTGCWQIRVGRRCPGLSDLPGSEARPRPCGLLANQEGGCPGLPKTRGACLFVRQPGRAVGCRYGCRPARKRRSGRMPGRLRPDARPAGIAWVSQPNRAVGLPERGACCGYGRSAVLAARKK